MTDGSEELDALPQDPEHDTRIGSDELDDLPASPPDRQPRSASDFGGDADPVEDTIDTRIAQEEPDTDADSAYGAPEDERGLDASEQPDIVGGEDPDAIPAEDDVLGSGHLPPSEDTPSTSPEEAGIRVEPDGP